MSSQCTCEICGKTFKSITNTHLKQHGITVTDYKIKFPNAILTSSEISAKLSENAKSLNAARDYSELGKKISATKQKMTIIPWNKGIPMSNDQKLKLSKTKLGKESPRKGAILSQETKDKIADALKAFSNTEEKIKSRLEKKLHEKKIKQQLELDRFNLYNSNIKVNDLELVNIDYKSKIVEIKCCKCGNTFQRSKQAVEQSKSNKTKCRICNPPSRSSIGQLEIQEFINSLGIKTISEDRSKLHGKEIDILIPELNIGIEYNGLYWHSELNYGEPKHLLWKQQYAHNEGIRLIHIFEDEWLNKPEIVKSRIANLLGLQKTKIYARQCNVQKISSSDKNQFLDENHLQGKDISGISYGLFYETELVSVMTFKPGSFIKGHKNGWELNRFSSKLNLSVVGGASKLFKTFIKEHAPEKIISFADRRWNTGNLYNVLGFKFSHCSAPSYWYLEKYARRLHRGKFMKHTLINSEADHKKTEWEIMQERGYDRIWDCGTVVYEWNKS